MCANLVMNAMGFPLINSTSSIVQHGSQMGLYVVCVIVLGFLGRNTTAKLL
jgi:hypothetical protein